MTDYKQAPKSIVDELAQFIRKVDGNHSMGAGVLAEKICERFRVVTPDVQSEHVESLWMYKGSDGEWKPFINEQHRLNTIADGGWDVREFFSTPAVQGEPVAAVVEEVFGSDGTSDFINARLPVGTKLYTAPQPAEQQPELCRTQPCGCVICFCENETQCMGCGAKHCGTHPVGQLPNPVYQQPAEQHPEAVREGAPYDDPAFESLCREHEIWGTPAAAQCAVFWEAGKRVAEQQPAPDVAGLVEALKSIEEWVMRYADPKHPVATVARKALADYRKQGGEA